MAHPTDDQIDARSRGIKNQHNAVRLLAVVVIVSALRIVIFRPAPQPYARLAEYVLAEGNETPLPAEIAAFFDIPNDGHPLKFRLIEAGSDDGRRHSIAARTRPETKHVDILLSDTTSEGHGYHYLTGTHGLCSKAAYADTAMRPVQDAAKRFAVEIKNWLEYLDNAGGH